MPSRRTFLRRASSLPLLLGAGCTSSGQSSLTSTTRGSSDTTTSTTPTATTKRQTTSEQGQTTTNAGPFSFTLTFDRTVPRDGRNVSVRCSKLKLYGGTGHELKTYDVGGPTDELTFDGAFDPKSSDERTWRWFGERVTIGFADKYEDSAYFAFSGVKLTCATPTTDSPITGTIHADESHSIPFDEPGWNDYFFSFHGAVD